jgi:hypothetical protein
MLSHTRPVSSSETGQKCLLRRPLRAQRGTCCPIRSKVVEHVSTLPWHRAQARKQPRETVTPGTTGVQESQQDVHQQRGPCLPLDRLAAVAEEVAQAQRLLDLIPCFRATTFGTRCGGMTSQT